MLRHGGQLEQEVDEIGRRDATANPLPPFLGRHLSELFLVFEATEAEDLLELVDDEEEVGPLLTKPRLEALEQSVGVAFRDGLFQSVGE